MRPTLIPAAAMFAAALALPVFAQDNPPEPGVITIEAVGEVVATPDMAMINSGVTNDGKTAREALDANTAAMNALLEALRAAGIEERDIQTSGFSVQPNYVYSDQRDASGYQLPPVISGYRVSNNVTVRVRDLDILGAVLDQAVTVGANTINSVSFMVADTDALYAEARRLAVGNAREKAEQIVDAAGVELGRIRSISEAGVVQPFEMSMARFDMAAQAAPVPVAAGELTFVATLSIQWELVQ